LGRQPPPPPPPATPRAAAFSTSSPVLAQVDFTGYNDVVAASLSNTLVGGSQVRQQPCRTPSPTLSHGSTRPRARAQSCLANIKAAFGVIDTQLRGTPQQQAAITAKMSACAPPTSLDDVKNVANNLAGTVMGIVQCACRHRGGGEGRWVAADSRSLPHAGVCRQ
jgi:hypothetical protein